MYAITIPLSWKHNDYTGHLTHHIWHHSHYICVITQMPHTSVSTYRSIDDITTSVQVITLGTHMTSFPIYIPSHSHYMTWMIMFYVITYTEFMTSDLLSMTSYPIFRTSHHFMYDIKSTVSVHTSTASVLTSTASVSSHPTYRWLHSLYMEGITCNISVISYPLCFWQNIYKSVTLQHSVLMSPRSHLCDILCTADDIAYTLSHQTTVFMISHPLQASHHTPCIRHCTHFNFVITSSPLISHPLLNDITPTFCVTSYAL